MTPGQQEVGVRVRPDAAVIWHDVECADYVADLPLWRRLAADANGPVLDLGCGTGRVALDLASRGTDLTALDSDPALVRALRARARQRRLPMRTHVADARSFDLGRRFDLVIAPMQVAQLLGGPEGRARMLAMARRHLFRGGRLAVALADPFDGAPAEEMLPPLPDVREADGWIFYSTPVALRDEGGATAIDRLRQSVSPEGDLSESLATVLLDAVDPAELEGAAERVGYRVQPRRRVPPTEAYVGSTVVILEAVGEG